MAEKKQYSRALFTFYTLVIYVVLQFFWWSVLLVKETHNLFMVAGEGTVFLSIMLLGVLRVQSSYRKERELLSRQNTFLHSVTHEFKSPVASLRLQLETLKKAMDNGQLTINNEPLSIVNCQLLLSNALEDTDRLNLLLEKTLTAARIDNGELLLAGMNAEGKYLSEISSINLSEKTNELVEQLMRKNPQRTIAADIQKDIFMKIDPWAFESILTNLVENAFLYSPANKSVFVSLSTFTTQHSQPNIRLMVRDEGIGVPDKDKQKIFQKFYRAEATSGYKGTGLGLFLVDYFVKIHGGAIHVKDNKPKGSIFEIAFPVTAIS